MTDRTMQEWFEAFESDKPVSDGAWANAWAPIWENAPVKPNGLPIRYFGKAKAQLEDMTQGGTRNHG